MQSKNKDVGISNIIDRWERYCNAKGYCTKTGERKILLEQGNSGSSIKQINPVKKRSSQGNRLYDISGISTTLSANSGGLGGKTGLYLFSGIDLSTDCPKLTNVSRTIQARYYKGYSKRKAETTGVFETQAVLTPDRLNKKQNGRRIKNAEEPMFTLTAQDRHGILTGSRIRRLTPVECERLMGLEDGFTELGMDTKQLVSYKKCGKIEVWNKSQIERIKGQNVRLKVVVENKRPVKVIASCTINDGNATELPNCSPKSIGQNKNVNIVIDWSEELGLWECVINTTKCTDCMATHFMLRKNGNNQVEMAILEKEMVQTPIEDSWKTISEESLRQMKLCTTSTAINWIIESVISTSAPGQSTHLSISNLIRYSKKEWRCNILYLRTESIVQISDSARYKMCGNGVCVPCVTFLSSMLLDT